MEGRCMRTRWRDKVFHVPLDASAVEACSEDNSSTTKQMDKDVRHLPCYTSNGQADLFNLSQEPMFLN